MMYRRFEPDTVHAATLTDSARELMSQKIRMGCVQYLESTISRVFLSPSKVGSRHLGGLIVSLDISREPGSCLFSKEQVYFLSSDVHQLRHITEPRDYTADKIMHNAPLETIIGKRVLALELLGQYSPKGVLGVQRYEEGKIRRLKSEQFFF